MKYEIKIQGQKTGFNAHTFEGVFSFSSKADADAAYDGMLDSSILDPELDIKMTKLYGQNTRKK